MKRITILLAAVALVAVGAVAVAPALAGPAPVTASAAKKKAKKPVTKIVKIFDNYYTPPKQSIKVGDSLKWVWPSDVGDTHDVNLGTGPKGVKAWSSPSYAARASFKKTFTKAGTYQLYCSFHQGEMIMTVVVKK